ncbi:MAG: slipin family protein [Candidatus Thorarchaeota archaeon]|nr:MAG: slipin family protein [Candidatus Thorarchaeota archaeon]RLI57858.1 MAG: slipin family protein [Candidatus Thorarchaeota archaeon]
MLDQTTLTIALLFILFIIIVFVLSGIKVLREWDRVAILRLGKYSGIKGPGIIFVVPMIDKIAMKVSVRLLTYAFKTERSLTKDNVPVVVDAVMYFKIIDVEKAILSVERYTVAVELAAQTTLRETIGKVTLDELLSERDTIAQHLQELIDEKTEHWGVKVTSVEIRDVVIPAALQDAMSREAQAERERRARVTLAQAELEASEAMLKAAKTYEQSSVGLTLRTWNIMQEISKNANLIIMVPTSIPEVGSATAAAISAGTGGLKVPKNKGSPQ